MCRPFRQHCDAHPPLRRSGDGEMKRKTNHSYEYVCIPDTNIFISDDCEAGIGDTPTQHHRSTAPEYRGAGRHNWNGYVAVNRGCTEWLETSATATPNYTSQTFWTRELSCWKFHLLITINLDQFGRKCAPAETQSFIKRSFVKSIRGKRWMWEHFMQSRNENVDAGTIVLIVRMGWGAEGKIRGPGSILYRFDVLTTKWKAID